MSAGRRLFSRIRVRLRPFCFSSPSRGNCKPRSPSSVSSSRPPPLPRPNRSRILLSFNVDVVPTPTPCRAFPLSSPTRNRNPTNEASPGKEEEPRLGYGDRKSVV